MAKPRRKGKKISYVKPVLAGLGVGLFVLGAAWSFPAVRNNLHSEPVFAKTTGPVGTGKPVAASSPLDIKDKHMFNVDPYEAPELAGVTDWINSDPLTIMGLKGKVILVDFWTFSCINCQNTQPSLNKWQADYASKGLVILGIHAPEFAYEQVPENVKAAVKAAKIIYPVGLDNSFTTWNAYGNQYWPARYLIDKHGIVRYTHFGEGAYDTTDYVIKTLLAEK